MTFDDFVATHTPIKPYTLMDLDDTLFQTKRKLTDINQPLITASHNKQDKPLSFFTRKQAHFFYWLHAHTTLIPVTARDRAEFARVKLPFDNLKVLTHGAVILDKENKPLPAWEKHIATPLSALQSTLYTTLSTLQDLGDDFIITPHSDEFMGTDLMIYLAIKHRQKDHKTLSRLANKLMTMPNIEQDFYVHINANNLAILPHFIHKRHAVAFLKSHYLPNTTPMFGFGDSLADLPFLSLLDWYGTPNRGQLHNLIQQKSRP
ncbi:MAG: hypothetical protein Q3971_00030 [Moraxella sp.]|nr:hypothetical protein [Moraxella sp.]